MARIKIRKNTIAPIHTFFDEVQPYNISNNNNDIISQSTIVAQKENTFMNTLENNNLSIMNFNPTVSRSLEANIEITDNQYLNINLVSNYIYLLYNINFLNNIIAFSQLQS